jgi:hypothetical protein
MHVGYRIGYETLLSMRRELTIALPSFPGPTKETHGRKIRMGEHRSKSNHQGVSHNARYCHVLSFQPLPMVLFPYANKPLQAMENRWQTKGQNKKTATNYRYLRAK